MTIDKKIKYEMQGKVRNYLGKQKMVKAPLNWQSGPDHPATELAYITKKEKDLLVKKDLHNSLNGGVNRGPSGIMSLNGWGSADEGQNVSGAAASAAETGSGNARDRAQVQAEFAGSGPALPPGVTPQDALDFRAAAINAGAGQRVNPGFFDSRTHLDADETAMAKAYRQNPNNRFAKQSYRNTGQGGLRGFISGGGIFGNLLRGVGQKFGFGKKYNQPTYDMRGLVSENPEYYDDLDNELMLSTEQTPIVPGSNTTNKVPISNTFVRPLDQRMTEGVVEGPYRNMFDYLEYDDGSNRPQRDPITFHPSYGNINTDGIVNTDAFTSTDGLGFFDGS